MTIDLSWKDFNVNGNLVLSNLKALSSKVVGTSHNSKFQIHFLEQPEQEELDAILAYWDSLDEDSEEATSYLSGSEVTQNEQAANLALKESAKAKLLLLGLSEAEIAAFLGV